MKSDMAKLKCMFRGKTWQRSDEVPVGDTIRLPEILMTKSTDHEDDEDDMPKSQPIDIKRKKPVTSSLDAMFKPLSKTDLREVFARPRADTETTLRPAGLDDVLGNPSHSDRYPLPPGYVIPPLNMFTAKKEDGSTSAASLTARSSMSSVAWPDPTSISYLDPIGMSNSSLKGSDTAEIKRHGTPKIMKEMHGQIDDMLAYQKEPSAPPLEPVADSQDPGVAGANIAPSPPSSTASFAVTSESGSSSEESSGLLPGGDYDGTEGLTMKAVGSRAGGGAEIAPLAPRAGRSRPRLTKGEEREAVAALTAQLAAEGVGEVVEGPFPETGATLTVSAGCPAGDGVGWGGVEDEVLAFFAEMAKKEF